jgi:hypothetical protein
MNDRGRDKRNLGIVFSDTNRERRDAEDADDKDNADDTNGLETGDEPESQVGEVIWS